MPTDAARHRVRSYAACVLAMASVMLPAVASPATTVAAPLLICSYRFTAWSGGFAADVTVTNDGPAIEGWTVRWTFGTSTTVTAGWQAKIDVHNGVDVSATNMAYNAVIRTGQVATFGWTATAATTSAPTDMTVNGTPC